MAMLGRHTPTGKGQVGMKVFAVLHACCVMPAGKANAACACPSSPAMSCPACHAMPCHVPCHKTKPKMQKRSQSFMPMGIACQRRHSTAKKVPTSHGQQQRR